MDTENITILEDDLVLAQALCSSISNSNIRNRAMANVIGAKIASRYFDEKYNVDSETGLHNIANILENIDVSDIYINNAYVDVRVYFNSDELSVPKLHYDYGIMPVAYMFVKLSSDLSRGFVTGFILSENVNKDYLKDGYYYISEDSLSSFYNIESHFATVLDVIDVSSELIYNSLDGTLDKNLQISLVKDLIKSKNSRIKFAKILKAQSVLNLVSSQDAVDSESSETDSLVENELNAMFEPEAEEKTIDEDGLLNSLEYSTEVTPNNADLLEEDVNEENEQAEPVEQPELDDVNNEQNEEIETLFDNKEDTPIAQKKSSGALTLILCILLLVGTGFLIYTNFISKNSGPLPTTELPESDNTFDSGVNSNVSAPPPQQTDAMPIETVEATPSNSKSKQEEAVSVAMPSVEKHLDASVLVSNLKVEWVIPSGYANNSAVKRYLYKLGKIIQLNLKTELLLLSKPPLSSKITVEFSFNPNLGRFELVGIKDSSGEKTVDDTIVQTIKSVLDIHISSNVESFGKLQGNPVLIIRL